MHSLYVAALNFYLQSAKRKWSLTSCTKCYSAHHSVRGESAEDEVCKELLLTYQRGLKIYNCRGRSPRLRGRYRSWILYAILGIIHTACGDWDAGKCYGWCGGQSQYPRENCYLRQLPSTFIGKSGDELVTNLQGYLKVGNVNPQAVNFEINFYLYKFSAGIWDFSYVSRPVI